MSMAELQGMLGGFGEDQTDPTESEKEVMTDIRVP